MTSGIRACRLGTRPSRAGSTISMPARWDRSTPRYTRRLGLTRLINALNLDTVELQSHPVRLVVGSPTLDIRPTRPTTRGSRRWKRLIFVELRLNLRGNPSLRSNADKVKRATEPQSTSRKEGSISSTLHPSSVRSGSKGRVFKPSPLRRLDLLRRRSELRRLDLLRRRSERTRKKFSTLPDDPTSGLHPARRPRSI